MHVTEQDRLDGRPRWKKIADFPLVALVIAVALYVGAFAVVKIVNDGFGPAHGDAQLALRTLMAVALLLVVYKLAIRRLGAVPHDDLPLAGAAKGLALGLLIGLLLFASVVGVAALFGAYHIVGPGSTVELAEAILAMAIMPGFTEELLFRGILFRWLEQFGGSWFALALTAALFGLGHIFNPHATALSSFAIAIEAGILLGGAYMLTRSLWMPIGLHAAWNFTQGEIFDVNVSGIDVHGLVTSRMSGPEILSGGSFGLEASLIAMVIATAAGVVMVVLAVRRGELVRPYWVRRRLASEETVRIDVNRDANLGGPIEAA